MSISDQIARQTYDWNAFLTVSVTNYKQSFNNSSLTQNQLAECKQQLLQWNKEIWVKLRDLSVHLKDAPPEQMNSYVLLIGALQHTVKRVDKLYKQMNMQTELSWSFLDGHFEKLN